MSEQNPKYLPTPEQIRKMTAEIRKTWCKEDYVIRAPCRGGQTVNYLPATVYKLHVSREALSRSID